TRAGGQRHLFSDLALSLEHHAAEVPVAHAEFDRDIALLVFAIDKGRPRDQAYLGHVGERDGDDPDAARVSRPDRDVPDRVEALTVLRRQSNDDREVA